MQRPCYLYDTQQRHPHCAGAKTRNENMPHDDRHPGEYHPSDAWEIPGC